jgi:hypothetical protein
MIRLSAKTYSQNATEIACFSGETPGYAQGKSQNGELARSVHMLS